jgi:hypothetical protein
MATLGLVSLSGRRRFVKPATGPSTVIGSRGDWAKDEYKEESHCGTAETGKSKSIPSSDHKTGKMFPDLPLLIPCYVLS